MDGWVAKRDGVEVAVMVVIEEVRNGGEGGTV